MPPDVVIDGKAFSDFFGFVAEFNRAFCGVYGGPPWDGQDFNDLDNWLELPGERFCIRWINSSKSRSELGHDAMAEFLRRGLAECEANFPDVKFMQEESAALLAASVSKQGKTLFDYLVDELNYEGHCEISLE